MTLFVVTRVLFRVLCSGVFVFHVRSLRKMRKLVLQLVVLVVTVIVGPGCERLVRFVVLVIEFSHAWGVSCSFIVCLGLFFAIGTVRSYWSLRLLLTLIKVPWKSLIFLIILLQLALLVAFSITCIVLFAILLICVAICVTMAIISMIAVTSVCRGGVMFGSFSFCTPCVNCVSAMSHARSGILLFGTAFLPSLVFSWFALPHTVYRLSRSWVFS